MSSQAKRPRDANLLAHAVVAESTTERETLEELQRLFWEETGIIAPGLEILPPLTDKWGEEKRWAEWRSWIEARKRGDRTAAAAKGGRAGGKARAEALSAERRSEIAKKAAAARWAKRPAE